jgi:hypothetical protein
LFNSASTAIAYSNVAGQLTRKILNQRRATVLAITPLLRPGF